MADKAKVTIEAFGTSEKLREAFEKIKNSSNEAK